MQVYLIEALLKFSCFSLVPEYEISNPTYHQDDGKSYFHSNEFSRKRRSAEDGGDENEHQTRFGFGIKAFGRNFDMSLTLNKHLLAPNFKVEIHRKNGTELSKKSIQNCHYTGKVRGGSGSAAVSNCNGLVSQSLSFLLILLLYCKFIW